MADAKGTLAHSKVVFPLHGISTRAHWQRTATDVLRTQGWICRLNRWYFGCFSVFGLLIRRRRRKKILWFRATYNSEVHDSDVPVSKDNPPSVIAHSFGTYILGNALLTYKYLYFDKVLLCGSILPRNFPWDDLINRGQVQAVRNEYSSKDRWARIVRWFVPGAGPSGSVGFLVSHERFEQERFAYEHSEYFDRGHIESKWSPFLSRQLPFITSKDLEVRVPRSQRPWLLYTIYCGFLAGLLYISFPAIADKFAFYVPRQFMSYDSYTVSMANYPCIKSNNVKIISIPGRDYPPSINLQTRLSKKGCEVEGPYPRSDQKENINSNEIRYFHDTDSLDAEIVARYIKYELNIDLIPKHIKGYPREPLGQLEIWIK